MSEEKAKREEEFWEKLEKVLDELVKKAKSFDELMGDEKIKELFNDFMGVSLLKAVELPDLKRQNDEYINRMCKAFKSLEKFLVDSVKAIEEERQLNWHAGLFYVSNLFKDNPIKELSNVKDIQELKAKIDELAKSGKINKDRLFVLPLELSEFCKELGEAEFNHFWFSFNVGSYIGSTFGTIIARNAIVFKMAELEKEFRNPADRFLALYLWLIREDKPNDIEKEIIRNLHRRKYSYRDIAKLCNRSLDTIHRILKDNN